MTRVALAILLFSSTAFSGDETGFPTWKISGLVDVRFISPDQDESWLDRGMGKTRYGEGQEVLRLSQVSAVLHSSWSESFSIGLHVNVEADSKRSLNAGRFDVVETFARFRPVLSPSTRLRFRGGFFFPAISLENRDVAWTSPFSITPSAINSWIGEEVRVTGVEATVIYSHAFTEYSTTAGLFGNNDPAGTLLAWRGWSFHDRQTGFTDRLPLADLPAISPVGLFPDQPAFVEPFREVDGRPGYYGAASVRNRLFHLNALYYNNRGRPEEFDGVQYAWKTNFINIGVELPVGSNFEVLSQYMSGNSEMGVGGKVRIRFQSAYILASATFHRLRLSARFDDFRIKDLDSYEAIDNSNEKGHSWMFAGNIRIAERHAVLAEALRIQSERSQRLPVEAGGWQFQTALRLRF